MAGFQVSLEAAIRFEKWLGANPVEHVRKQKVAPREPAVLTVEEVGRLLTAASPAHAPIFAVAVYAALRKGEVIALQKSDVDLRQGLLHIRGSNERRVTKGGHHSTIPLHPELRPWLVEAMRTPGPWVFPDTNGEQRKSVGFQPERALRRALAKAGLVSHFERSCRRKGCGFRDRADTDAAGSCPRCGFKLWIAPVGKQLRFHDLRHTAASLLLEAGTDLHAVQLILRHANPQTTMSRYGHLRPDYLRQQMERFSVTKTAPANDVPTGLATPLLPGTNEDVEDDPGEPDQEKKNPAFLRGSPGGADGTRTRGLRRDRPAL